MIAVWLAWTFCWLRRQAFRQGPGGHHCCQPAARYCQAPKVAWLALQGNGAPQSISIPFFRLARLSMIECIRLAHQRPANSRMWFIQTTVETLALPTDNVGRSRLTGSVTAWHHLVRDNTFAEPDRAAISQMPINWSIWGWQQLGRRVQLHDTIAMHEPLAEMVRAEPYRCCVFTRFPESGKRQSDRTIELIMVVPPEQFSRYEALVQFAMTLRAGHVSMTLRSPVLPTKEIALAKSQTLITPGTHSLTEGAEMVVARGKATKMSSADLRPERRSAPPEHGPAHILHDDGDDWLLFAAEPVSEPGILEDSAKE